MYLKFMVVVVDKWFWWFLIIWMKLMNWRVIMV